MASSLDSICGDITHPERRSSPIKHAEECIDRFATLFSPPTPRASPTNSPPLIHPTLESPRSPDGEFGTFVSVPPSQDPLAAEPFSPVDVEPSTSRIFFEEAARAQERNRREVLDGLIQDEPLFRDKEPPAEVDLYLDLDDDFFRAKTSSVLPSLVSTALSSRHHYSPPSRASTLSAATPAPPVASTSSVSTPVAHSETLPSRWLDTFLPPRSPPSPSARATLDSLFDHHVEPQRPHSVVPVEISHDTPFAPHGSASETSSVVYIPPSGAPGFRGEEYAWDKGFSMQLEKELESKINSHDRAASVPIGGLIEKKMGDVELKGRREGTVCVLDITLATMIRPQLPALSRLSRSWTLLYSLDQHGISLNTLYSRSEQSKPTGVLIVVKDEGETIFGAFIGDGIRKSSGKGYYGTGESFLWRYVNGKLSVYKTTGRNDYIALSERESLSFGGGDGSYGLYIEKSLLEGSSAKCLTFGNEVLCSPGRTRAGGAVPFECVGLEVWRVGP
ncbi:TLD-domain-containing protein [Guyanagaster necrorhizus]|uniref:Oxidation resistance protein 1 n=1 Tax=Guyanagaster necrorhizus TaxID=856835 RepID=A0A9P8AL91_9AGAR|nr:TLD-domain-containing protein [Guyanagaster necrorhizus MCA 3950]KAG7439983.1 TLD-domain-containing protein [Guyanagaster necrorhizus MCA 3950]